MSAYFSFFEFKKMCDKSFTTILLLACTFTFFSCTSLAEDALNFEILETREHDALIFTQGFELHDTTAYVSSGLYGRSFLRSYDHKTLRVINELALPKHIFAEGITIKNNTLYALSWHAGIMFFVDPLTLKIKGKAQYSGEGWGLTHDEKSLIMSNGSDTLYYRDPTTLEVTHTINVHNQWRKYKKLNELEYAEGVIWANVWGSDYILKIDPESGKSLGIVNLHSIVSKHNSRPGHTVLNGIAYDEKQKAFWITGKLWPKQYLVKFSKKKKDSAP